MLSLELKGLKQILRIKKTKTKTKEKTKKWNKTMIQRRSYLESVVQINFQLVVGRF